MVNAIKTVGGLLWLTGIVMLFFDPSLAWLILAAALAATIYVMMKERDQTAEELVEDVEGEPQPDIRPSSPTMTTTDPRPASERLAELEDLRETGAITQAEYEGKRREILDSI